MILLYLSKLGSKHLVHCYSLKSTLHSDFPSFSWMSFFCSRGHPGYHILSSCLLNVLWSVPDFQTCLVFDALVRFEECWVGNFVECPSVWIFLTFFLFLDWGYGFLRGRPLEKGHSLLHVWREHAIHMTYPDDVDLDYLAKVAIARFLHNQFIPFYYFHALLFGVYH